MTAELEDPIVNKFVDFSESRDLPVIQSAFSSLCDAIDLDPLCYNGFYTSLKSKLQQWKCKALWKLLDARASLPEYVNQNACKGRKVLVIGAGPVGLRLAIEAALLGAEVDIVEKRTGFSRNNVLHLWPFLIDDLRGLGAKRFYGKFCAGAIDHVCIRTVQSILLKIALVLGVKVHFPVTFIDYIEPTSTNDSWHIKVDPSSSILSKRSYDAILCADGKQQSLKCFKSKEFRAKLAIAITANFVNRNTNEEAAVEEISGVSYIYNQSFFKSLSQQYGIDLENIVYYKDETHYFVMTAKKSSLLGKGVLKKDHADLSQLLSPDNISQTALEQYSRDAASYSTNGRLRNLEFATNHRGNHDVAIFDFTSLFASKNASMIMERKGKRLLMGVAGDTLLEPFWPTGSGLARGFLGALDAAWMLKHFCEGTRSPLELIEERETLFHLLPSTTPERLQKKTSSYTLNPHTRYPNLNLLVPPTNFSYLYDSDTYDSRIIKPADHTPLDHTLLPPTEPKIMRFHSVGAQDGNRIKPVKRKHDIVEEPPTPPEVIEDINVEPYTPSKTHAESSLLKFAKKLFGIKTTPKTTPKATPKHESQTKQTVSEKQAQRNADESAGSPRKSPKKKKRRKSKATPQHNREGQAVQVTPPPEQSHSEVVPRDKQPPEKQHKKTTGGGVSELTRLYERGGMGEKNNGGSQQRTTVPKVSVAMVIERLEKHKQDGVDTTDYEKNIAMLVNEGIEEVDSIVLEDIERLANKKEVDGQDGGEHEDISSKITGGRMRPQSNEILDEESMNKSDTAIEDSSTGTSSQQHQHPSDNDQVPHEPGQQLVSEVPSEGNDQFASVITSPEENTLLNKDTTPTSLLKQSIIEERKLQMGLPTSTKTIAKIQEESKPLCQISPFTSPIRSGSKDDSVIGISLPSTKILPTPSWRKKFVDNLNLILEQFRNETDVQNVKVALEIMNFIYENISDDPYEDTYRRIRISSSRFLQCVWQYEHTKLFFISCSWMEVDDYLVLPMEHSTDIAQSVLTRQIEIVDMVMHSKHISALIQQHTSEGGGGAEDKYTDSIVMKGVKKANLDYSVKVAQNAKASLPRPPVITSCESTDHPWISKQEESFILESAAMAREWWENKDEDYNSVVDHPNNYSIYFHEEEMNVLNHLGQQMRGRVAHRIRNFQGEGDLSSDNTSTGSSGSSSDDEGLEETDHGCHDNNGNHGDVQEVDSIGDKNMGVVKDTGVVGVRVPDFIKSAGQEARNKWKKMGESTGTGISVTNETLVTDIQSTSSDQLLTDTDPQQKWMLAQRMSEQLQLKKQQSNKAED